MSFWVRPSSTIANTVASSGVFRQPGIGARDCFCCAASADSNALPSPPSRMSYRRQILRVLSHTPVTNAPQLLSNAHRVGAKEMGVCGTVGQRWEGGAGTGR